MSKYIHKSHNVTVLLYHLVFPAKYRRAIFDEAVDEKIRAVCLEIEKRYQLKFLEIGTDKDHVHFLVQSVKECRKRSECDDACVAVEANVLLRLSVGMGTK